MSSSKTSPPTQLPLVDKGCLPKETPKATPYRPTLPKAESEDDETLVNHPIIFDTWKNDTLLNIPEPDWNQRESNVSPEWKTGCGRNGLVSKSFIVYMVQVVLIYIVAFVSIFNLSRSQCNGSDQKLWIAILASAIGYLLPSPAITSTKTLLQQ